MVEIDAHDVVALDEKLQHARGGEAVERGQVREVDLRDEIERLAVAVHRPFFALADPDGAAEAATVGADRLRGVGAQFGGGQRVCGKPVLDCHNFGVGQRRPGR